MAGNARDDVLGRALGRLEVPDHRPGFHPALRARLRQEAHGAGLRRGPYIPDRRGRASRPGPWAWGLSAAAAVVLAVLVVMWTLPGTEPRAATAAEVRRAVTRAWASAENVSGVLVFRAPGAERWAFTLTARGDLRLDNLTRGDSVVLDAEKGASRYLEAPESDREVQLASVWRGLAPGPPDSWSAGTLLLDRGLGSVVRALAAGGGGRVKETTYEGRPAWLLETDIRVSLITPDLSPDHLEVTVDVRTGFPVRVVATRHGELIWETRIEDLKVDQPVPDEAFRLQFPPGTKVHRGDAGFRRVSVEGIEGIVGYDPLVPSWIPDGYGLVDVTASRRGSFTGAEGANPPAEDVVSLSYRRGLDQFIVTTRPIGPDPLLWSDPLASGEGYRDEPEKITFESGALGGETGELLIDPLAIPHIWVMTDRLVVTVSGDLTRQELLRVAESLE